MTNIRSIRIYTIYYRASVLYRANASLQLDENKTIYDDSFKLVTLI